MTLGAVDITVRRTNLLVLIIHRARFDSATV